MPSKPKYFYPSAEWFDPAIWGTSHFDPFIRELAKATLVTEPELLFGQLWAELYPELDLWFQYPLVNRSNWDYAHVGTKTGIEIHGSIHVAGSGHRSSTGVQADMKKQKRAAERGWAYIPIKSDDVEDGAKLGEIADIIASRQKVLAA